MVDSSGMERLDIEHTSNELGYTEYIYGEDQKLTSSVVTKELICKAIEFLTHKSMNFYLPMENSDVTEIANWISVSREYFNETISAIKNKPNMGKKALIRILDCQVKKFYVNCSDRSTFLSDLAIIYKIINKSYKENSDQQSSSQRTYTYKELEELINEKVKALTVNEKIYKIDGLPRFKGDRSENIDQWLFQIDESLRTNNVAEHRILGIVTPLLKENALFEYRQLYTTYSHNLNALTWAIVKQHFRNVFGDIDEQRKIRNELRELTHRGNDDYNEYLRKFLSIRSRIVGLPESELLYSFIAGLSESVRGEVLAKKPASLVEAQNYANWFYDTKTTKTVNANYARKINKKKLHSQIQRKNSDSKSGNNQENTKSYSGYKKKSDKNMSSSKKSDSSKIQCYKCKRYGHKANRCSSSIQKSNLAEYDSESNNDSCDNDCNNGCEDSECSDNSESENEKVNVVETVDGLSASSNRKKVMNIQGNINHKQITCWIDTGATSSIMSCEAAKMLNLEVKNSDTKVRLADSSVSEVTGVTNPTIVEVKNVQVELKFLVLDNNSHAVLLGQDWLKKTKAILWPYKNDICFPEQKCEKLIESECFSNPDSIKEEEAHVFDNFY